MEICESIVSVKETKESDMVKVKLLDRLQGNESSLNKSLALAFTIQTMYGKDIDLLEKIFQFYLQRNQIERAAELLENDLLKKFKISETNCFDHHLRKFAQQIIINLSLINSPKVDQNTEDGLYFQLFLKLSVQCQEKLVVEILEKFRANCTLFKLCVMVNEVADKKPASQTNSSFDLKELYLKLSECKESIFLSKKLTIIFKKFIPEYGLFIIDGLLNVEKQYYTHLAQTSVQQHIDPTLLHSERRSLNAIRRICVADLIPDFIYLVDKLDNRHCYRWIEKSLEFFTKYTLSSAYAEILKNQDTNTNQVVLGYNAIGLFTVRRKCYLFKYILITDEYRFF